MEREETRMFGVTIALMANFWLHPHLKMVFWTPPLAGYDFGPCFREALSRSLKGTSHLTIGTNPSVKPHKLLIKLMSSQPFEKVTVPTETLLLVRVNSCATSV